MKKKIITVLLLLCTAIILMGCGKTYSNNFDGVYSYVADNTSKSSITFYTDWGNYGGWMETKAFLRTEHDLVIVSLYTYHYYDEEKKTNNATTSLIIKYDGTTNADYSYYYNANVFRYCNGVFKVGDYSGDASSVKITVTTSNMDSPLKSDFSFLTTILKDYLHSKNFTMDALGYSKYK